MDSDSVFIVDNDTDDQEMAQQVWDDLKIPNTLKFFQSGKEVLDYLKTGKEPPFIIISEVNLHSMDGFELRQALLDDSSLKYKSIPFIFWSTTSSKRQLQKAYDFGAHGFFIKEGDYDEVKKTFKNILDYWFKSKRPNDFSS